MNSIMTDAQNLVGSRDPMLCKMDSSKETHTVSVAAHVRAAIDSLKKAQTVLQIEIDRLEKQL